MNAWMMPDSVFAWLDARLQPDDVVLELGSGEGSARLATMCGELYSVEHDRAFIGKYDGPRYIYAPIHNGWYHADELRAGMPEHIDAIIVDGPPGEIGRGGLLDHLDMFPDVPMLFDDVHRKSGFELAMDVARVRKENISVHYLTEGRAFATVGWGDM